MTLQGVSGSYQSQDETTRERGAEVRLMARSLASRSAIVPIVQGLQAQQRTL
jgi:hypothetical protein